MLFNSLDFALFLPIVFSIYWLLQNRGVRLQNVFIILASYVFYGWWDWRFLILIFLSSLVDFLVGLGLGRETNPNSRKLLLWTSLIFNLGMLGFFKYFNFFLENFIAAFTILGQPIQAGTLNIILPVGISFYTFQTLSYSIDVYKNKVKPTSDPIAFLAFVSFFPQLVAGPIERASKLLPQFFNKRFFDYPIAIDGLRQILWGLFKKIVIADTLAAHVDTIFTNSTDLPGSVLAIGAFFFVIQIYTDFSGYSDIAIGVARLFGFNLTKNFDVPLFSRNHTEFWQRWHISLTTWFRDYIFIPLALQSKSRLRKISNYFLVFGVNGLWHGANWTYIWWGLINALYLIPSLITERKNRYTGVAAGTKFFPDVKEAFAILLTLTLTTLATIFFRSETVGQAIQFIFSIFSNPGSFLIPSIYFTYKMPIILAFFFLLIDWIGRKESYALQGILRNCSKPIRYTIYYSLIIFIFISNNSNQQYIYFQF